MTSSGSNLGPFSNSFIPQKQGTLANQSDNLLFQGADKITGFYDGSAQIQEQVPVVGGLMAAGTRLSGEVAALPLKAAGASGIATGSVIEFGGNVTDGTFKLASKVPGLAGDINDGISNTVTGVTDNIAQVESKIPVVGGLMAAGTKFSGEVLTLPNKVASLGFHAAESVVSFAGDVLSAPAKAVGGLIKKL